MAKAWFLSGLLLIACASSQTTGTRSGGAGTGWNGAASSEEQSGEGVPREKLDEIHEILRRKSNDLGHCWSEEAGRTGNRQLKIDILLKLAITPAGRPQEIEVLNDTSGSKEFEACVLGKMQGLEFPMIPSRIELTWPYSFKALY